MPMPSAASITAAGTLRKATAVLMRMGGMASTVSAATAGGVPTPSTGTHKMSTAKLGITRNTPATPPASRSVRALALQATPSGSASAQAASRAVALMAR